MPVSVTKLTLYSIPRGVSLASISAASSQVKATWSNVVNACVARSEMSVSLDRLKPKGCLCLCPGALVFVVDWSPLSILSTWVR